MKRFLPCLLLFCVLLPRCIFSQMSPPAWKYLGPTGANVYHIAASNDTLYATVDNGRFFRCVNAVQWEEITALGTIVPASGLTVTSSGSVRAAFLTPAFRGDDFGGAAYFATSTTAGLSWSRVLLRWSYNFSSRERAMVGIASVGSTLLALSQQGVVSITTNTFSFTQPIILSSTTLTCIAARNNTIIVGSQDSSLHRSFDGGKTWQNIRLPFTPRSLTFSSNASVIAASGTHLFRSDDTAATWQQRSALPTNASVQGLTIVSTPATVYLATQQGVFRSQNFGQTWEAFNNGLSTRLVGRLVANDSAAFAFVPHTGEFHRIDNEQFTPFRLSNGRTAAFLGATESHLWASNDSVLWRSRNGKDWINTGVLPCNTNSISAITSQYQERELYISTGAGLFRSNNIGQTWERLDSATLINAPSLAVTGDTMWLGNCEQAQFSLNKGRTWSNVRLGNHPGSCLYQLLSHEGVIFASGLYYGLDVFDEPMQWMARIFRLNFTSLASGYPPEAVESSALFLASRKRELLRAFRFAQAPIEYLPSNGSTWRQFPVLPSKSAVVVGFAANNNNIFVGTNSGLFVLNAVSTSVRETASTLGAIMHTAYPSPFSDDVTIECLFPLQTRLRLSIHNALGQEIAILHDGVISSGKSTFRWNAHGFPQGVYWYRLANGAAMQTGKIILMR